MAEGKLLKHLKTLEERPEASRRERWFWECKTCEKTGNPVWGYSTTEANAKEDFKHHRKEFGHK